MSGPPIIVYAYPSSPFSQKLFLVLDFHALPYSVVRVAIAPPRPELEVMGITYRKIPVMAIGNDVYVDTAMAAAALAAYPGAKPFPKAAGSTIMSFYWADRVLFSSASPFLPWGTLPQPFLDDRAEFSGGKIDPKAMEAGRPRFESALGVQLDLISTLLSASSTAFLLSTETPSYLDVSVYHVLHWISSFPSAPSFSKHPLIAPYLTAMDSHIAHLRSTLPKATKLSGAQAVQIIYSSPPASSAALAELNDATDPMGLKVGSTVEVTPDDTGRRPQRGVLRALGSKESVVQVTGKEGKTCLVHAPRIGFTIKSVREKL